MSKLAIAPPPGPESAGSPVPLSAHEPAEVSGSGRDDVRLLVGRRGTGEVTGHHFTELPELLAAGDVVVVNTSGTLPAAVPVLGGEFQVHLSTELADGRALVEVRRLDGTAPARTRTGWPASGTACPAAAQSN